MKASFLAFAVLAALHLCCGQQHPLQQDARHGTTWTDLADPTFHYDYTSWMDEFKPEPRFAGSRAAFDTNLATIRAHNAKTASWKMNVNKFSALTPQEFKANVIGRGYSKTGPHMAAARTAALNLQQQQPHALPASLDWRDKNVVTAVKNQGFCGGCWSFSAAETLESIVAIQTGKLLTFSEQEILACTPNPNHCGGTGGCSGATQELAFQYVMTKGITSEDQWPYSETTGTCDWKTRKAVASISNYVFLPVNNYTALIQAVATVGPVAISAAAEAWQFYSSGVLDTSSNCGTDVDHAIVLVGYGTDKASGNDFWLVRNSWGADWGESGYIRIQRFGEGKEPCAEDTTPADGDGCSGGPSEIPVCGLCGILSDSSYPTGPKLL